MDWVNAIALLGDGTLVSCSSDRTLRVWNALGSGRSEACLLGHTDYVTSLAAAVTRPLVASGGLGGEVYLWDIEALAAAASLPTGAPAGLKATGVRDSVYSIACDASGSVIAAGTSSGCISILDSRAGRVEAAVMAGQVVTIREARPAVCAGIGLLACVGALVHGQVANLCEAGPAFVADIGLLD